MRVVVSVVLQLYNGRVFFFVDQICYEHAKPSKQVHKSESSTPLLKDTAIPTKVTQGNSVAIPDGVRIHNDPSETTGYPIVDTSSEKQQINSGEM